SIKDNSCYRSYSGLVALGEGHQISPVVKCPTSNNGVQCLSIKTWEASTHSNEVLPSEEDR
ncbi:hypothetical protein STEG23_013595, partial [Scotinomys teguina]